MMQLPTTLPATDTMTVNCATEGYSGTIPTEFGLLTKLTELSVTNNWLTGAVPTQVKSKNTVFVTVFFAHMTGGGW